VLSDARYEAALPCSDLERAKSFYADKLGLTPADEQPAGAFYAGRDGTRFLLFPSSGSASGSHSQMGFIVADADAEVRDLKQRGVQFEEYDFPGFDKATSIAQIGEDRGAWFKDSEGNLLGIVQQR
jgi:catechol 2,3-dioxygenase-like lactoylglutathione lyase family enzyme